MQRVPVTVRGCNTLGNTWLEAADARVWGSPRAWRALEGLESMEGSKGVKGLEPELTFRILPKPETASTPPKGSHVT